MSFKDILNDDVNNIFFNIDEFSERHNIDGSDMPIMIDEDELQEYKIRREGDYEGLYKATLLFYVRKSDIGSKPAINSLIDFDDKIYKVLSSSEDGEVIKVILGWDED